MWSLLNAIFGETWHVVKEFHSAYKDLLLKSCEKFSKESFCFLDLLIFVPLKYGQVRLLLRLKASPLT